MEKKRIKIKKHNGMFIAIGIVFLLHGLSLLLPFIWMMLTSFKGLLDYQNNFLGLPKVWHFENYTKIFSLLRIEVIKNGDFYVFNVFDMLQNSLVLALFGSFFGLLPIVLCSYAVSRYNFIGKKLLFGINLFVMTVPIVGSLSNTLIIYKQFGIYNNLWLYMILPCVPFGFNWLLLYGVFKSIPDSYSEAVFIDGGGHFTVFFRIILPMVTPTLIALYVLSFISRWNDYSASLIYLPSVPTLAYGLYVFQYDAAKYGATLPEILAGFAICSVPSVVLFCSFQKTINRSLMIGGLKE
ncbi:MAG: carbohydrate ABC transporter permease [Candidatus Scatosoma sp.]